MEEYKNVKMSELDLIENYSKEELEELLQIQIEVENYEGAQLIKEAIKNYDLYEKDVFFDYEDDEE